MSLMLLFIAAAWPCAGIFHEDGALAESEVQEVLLTAGDGQVTASYRVSYEGDAAAFGWVIPIPGAFVSLEDGDGEVFDGLAEVTAPFVDYIKESSDGGGPSCGCGTENALSKGGGDTAGGGLEVVAEGFSGTYAYTVLEATTAEPLLAWLAENGWEAGPGEASIAEYVADGGFQFVAISLLPEEAETSDGGRELPPVDIVYAGDDLRYPARMARYAMVDALRTTVWVQAAHQVSVSGWSSQTLELIEHESAYDDSVEVFRDALYAISETSPTYNLTWSGSHDGGWLTRFDAYAPKEVHTADARFAVGSTDEEVQTTIRLGEADDADAAWLLLPMFGLGYGLRRRRA